MCNKIYYNYMCLSLVLFAFGFISIEDSTFICMLKICQIGSDCYY